GLTDVEWTVQLLQLQHAAALPELRLTGTMAALEALGEAALVAPADVRALQEAWRVGSLMRNAGVLWRGRPVESVPTDLRDAEGVGRIMGRPAGEASSLGELWRRVARRSRQATDFNFYDSPGGGSVVP
ncbi:MAG: bifunctional glutamine-synthetase adenylyltransferase/deadenyltransferase, partial [Humibacillus sp.]